MMDLGGDVMVESNQKIDSWAWMSKPLQYSSAAPSSSSWMVAGIPYLWIGLLIGYNLHIFLLSLNTTVIPSIARPYVFFL
jgi:hypothetical protein